MNLIEKPSIIITSLGRTGTEFFSKFYADILPGSTSLHEPDIFQSTRKDKLNHFILQVKQAGIWRMVILKSLGLWTLVKLSDERFIRKASPDRASKKLHLHRYGFVKRVPGKVYVESNIGYYGLLDITPNVFQNHKAIYIVRDGRDWIRSHINWGEFYAKKGLRKLISHNWPGAKDLPQDPYYSQWDNLSLFEKLCWAWARLNTYALNTLDKNPNARLFKFEEIFGGDGRYKTLDQLVEHTTSLPGISRGSIKSTKGWLEKKIHQSNEGFPNWSEWSDVQKQQFKTICGPLMEKMNYTLD